MPGGVVFLVCIPTLSYEHELIFGTPVKLPNKNENVKKSRSDKVDLRLKDSKRRHEFITIGEDEIEKDDGINRKFDNSKRRQLVDNKMSSSDYSRINKTSVFVPMETVLDELLKKLRIEHVVWCKDKSNMYHEVIFPVSAGDSCENCLHCLTEMGIGRRMNSIVSVIPTQCTYSGLSSSIPNSILDRSIDEKKDVEVHSSSWEAFVDSIRSKLTVKHVVDGVRNGGDLTFDYIALVLTADCLAALGLIENSATNVVAAMLVSPLMGPVMSITFGTIIADRDLFIVGLKSLLVGVVLSIIFGFIFGLLLGTTKMPWGYNDWPTDEMKSRGNYRSLWMGVLWALPSGTGVAVALLQGCNGPLIGVAISASLLPPVVNCGLFWALGCIWLIYRPIKMPHMKGESYTNYNTSYVNIYADYLPVEFFCNGIISACLTLINVVCIFITAIIVLKIKEVAAPYTSTPELRRFWEHDIPLARDKNTSRDNSSIDSSFYDNLSGAKRRALERTINEVVREAMKDETYRTVKRVSYGQQIQDEIPPYLGIGGNMNNGVVDDNVELRKLEGMTNMSCPWRWNVDNSEDLAALDRLITYLLGEPNGNWRHSRRSSILGYRPLGNNVIDDSMNSYATDLNTTPL